MCAATASGCNSDTRVQTAEHRCGDTYFHVHVGYAMMSFASNNDVDNGGDRKEAFSGFAGVPINAGRVSGPLYSMGLGRHSDAVT